MATTNTRYVDPNAPVGGDGTTNSIEVDDPHCAYKSLAIWEAARQADLPAGDIIEKVVCSSDDAGSTHLADTTSCTIDGWTTDATRYIQIEAASSHGGKWDDTMYRMARSYGVVLDVAEGYTRVIGLQFKTGNHPVMAGVGLRLNGASCLVDKVISRAGTFTGDPSCNGIVVYINASGSVIRNSLIYGWNDKSSVGISAILNPGTLTVYNTTIYDCVSGMNMFLGTLNATNVGCASCTTAFTGVNQTTCSSATPTFVDEDNDDFHLAPSDVTWRGQGTDLSAVFTDDIDGETRPTGAGTWDIGCDEYVGGVVPWLPQFNKPQYHPAFGGLTYG